MADHEPLEISGWGQWFMLSILLTYLFNSIDKLFFELKQKETAVCKWGQLRASGSWTTAVGCVLPQEWFLGNKDLPAIPEIMLQAPLPPFWFIFTKAEEFSLLFIPLYLLSLGCIPRLLTLLPHVDGYWIKHGLLLFVCKLLDVLDSWFLHQWNSNKDTYYLGFVLVS